MTSRARKVEKNELIKIVTEINRRMGDFEDSVQKLQDLKDTLEEVDESLAQQAAINKAKIDQMNKEFADNKIRAINQVVQEMDKVIITEEELAELRDQLQKVKTDSAEQLKVKVAEICTQYEDKLKNAMNVKQLEHDCETAYLKAEVETNKKEVENLNHTLDRMSEELKSQKQLTAEVAGMSRPAAHATSS